MVPVFHSVHVSHSLICVCSTKELTLKNGISVLFFVTQEIQAWSFLSRLIIQGQMRSPMLEFFLIASPTLSNLVGNLKRGFDPRLCIQN
jgi:hypothetical protein